MSSNPARAIAASPPAALASKNHPLMMLALVTLPVLIADQLSKHLISTNLELYRSRIPIIPGWLDLTYTLNPGAAFSLFATMPATFRRLFFVILSVAAIVVLTYLILRRTTTFIYSLGFALILGGTIGNLIDRVLRGRVVDFIYFHHGWFSYPVFNIADSAITIGVVMILLIGIFERSPSAASEKSAAAS